MLSFTAKATNRLSVDLQWATASEENNKGFHLQRSTDGKHFNNIQWIDGRGTTVETQTYQHLDQDVESGQLYYYRLRQLDYDGSTSFSQVATVRLEGDDITVGNFYPNPASRANEINLNITSKDYQPAYISLYDLKGALVYSSVFATAPGTNTIQISLKENWSGLYTARISMGSQNYFRKLLLH